jgi:hypothetical protein
MKAHLKTSGSTITQYVDPETGELFDQEIVTHSYITKDTDTFILMYVTLIGMLGDLSNSAVKVLSYILVNYKVNTEFEIGGATRRKISSRFNIGLSSVANGLTELKKENILYSKERSLYVINPRYAYQGSTSDRKGAMKAIIELGCKDC